MWRRVDRHGTEQTGSGAQKRGFNPNAAATAAALRAQPKKKKRKAGHGNGVDASIGYMQLTAPVTSRGPSQAEIAAAQAHMHVLQLLRSKQVMAAANLFVGCAEAAHGAAKDLLENLMKLGDLALAMQVVKAAKVSAPLSQASVIGTLLAMLGGLYK